MSVRSRSNWNLSEQGREPATISNHIWRRHRDSLVGGECSHHCATLVCWFGSWFSWFSCGHSTHGPTLTDISADSQDWIIRDSRDSRMPHEFLLCISWFPGCCWQKGEQCEGKLVEELSDRDLSSEMSFGFDEDFVSSIDEDLQCSICYLALREPVLTRCGHRFCRQCLDRHMARFVSSFYFRK